jgi:hypothetical protein
MFRIGTVPVAINKQFEWLFSGVFASHRGGPGSIPGRDMSVSGSLVKDEDDLGQVSSVSILNILLPV